jgi:hypothetical protein
LFGDTTGRKQRSQKENQTQTLSKEGWAMETEHWLSD